MYGHREFKRGAFPMAQNLPLLDDHQRETVGICYKHQGKQDAIRKGHELVHNDARDARVSAWIEFANRHPNGALYCFRGGLRSQIAQQWMHEAGTDFPVVEGGYKALRTFLLEALETLTWQCTFTLVGGMTGSGKTALVASLEHAVDLEPPHTTAAQASGATRKTSPPRSILRTAWPLIS